MPRENTPVIQVGDRAVETPELLAYLLSLANDFRRGGDAAELNAIPPSTPGVPSNCIIANALNFNCMIFPGEEAHTSRAAFEHIEDAERFAKLTGGAQVLTLDDYIGQWRYEVPLTPELNAIALAFDRGLLAELEVSKQAELERVLGA